MITKAFRQSVGGLFYKYGLKDWETIKQLVSIYQYALIKQMSNFTYSKMGKLLQMISIINQSTVKFIKHVPIIMKVKKNQKKKFWQYRNLIKYSNIRIISQMQIPVLQNSIQLISHTEFIKIQK